MTGGAAIVLTIALLLIGYPLAALIMLAIGTLATAALVPAERRTWVALGTPYAGALAVAPIVLRGEAQEGFLALLFLFAVVWTTDVSAYFVGRAVGGPRLMPQVSPGKTWSGALGGSFCAVAVAVALGKAIALPGLFSLAMLALVLSIVAQAGDLFESFVKRRFGAKDSSRLIPGHGGLMDRLDGFITAGMVAAVIGVVRGGLASPGRGLLVW
jgi:phosphatidate cytidylyltransferase